MDLKKWVQKTGSLLFKMRRGQAVSSLFDNNGPVFCNLLYSGPYFGPDYFQGHKPTHVFKTRIVGAD